MLQPEDVLRELEADGLLRGLRPLDSAAGASVNRSGRELWNFASNDYLGLSGHERIKDTFCEGIGRFGAGSTASRLVCGTQPPHLLLEETLAEKKRTEAALTFSSGYATALGTIPVIAGKDDFIILDKLSHASLVDASRLSGATLRVFPHNDMGKLSRLLSSIRAKSPHATILVVTESVFSMDGDLCPLREIVDLTEAHGALLFLDEAHAIGVLGNHGMGLADELDLQERIAFQMGTLSKAVGLSGGYVAASRAWIDLFINRARSFIFSTAPPPAVAHAATASLELIDSPEGAALRERLFSNIRFLKDHPSPVIPHIFGGNHETLDAAASLESSGFLVPAIRFPTVPRGTARLRVSISASHPPAAVTALAAAISALANPATRS
ncbi:8-amino-7-oxononanoate synthase [Luteolibacter sp. SL250]|uniref:aminotransferase class I/II-fold pyridoxal phosphate-dependent enzyme n=1 Tax=Luteolibacter sp. SL250 TaxID=2995170 RepID=UPI00226FF1B2|nr:8-amino-7-oxononanoate synthase [Luteolibacter sp. SL250]WAC21814.1 8-amino-7-oxononanoate synthase [Luteolibacter sp. SL250]